MDDRRFLLLGFMVSLFACGEREEPVAVSAVVVVDLRFDKSCRSAVECPGKKCVRLGQNLQRIPGICSRSCLSDDDCGEGGTCFALGKAGPTCLAKCSAVVKNEAFPPGQPTCPEGLACVPVGAMGETACFVEPTIRPTADRGAG